MNNVAGKLKKYFSVNNEFPDINYYAVMLSI